MSDIEVTYETRNMPSRPPQVIATYRNLMVFLSDAIGSHQLPLIKEAMRPKEFVAPDAVHYDLVKKIAHSVYKANRCFHINAPVNYERTFNALGIIHGELIRSSKTDIDQMNLIHDIGVRAADFFDSCHSVQPIFVPDFKDSNSVISLRR